MAGTGYTVALDTIKANYAALQQYLHARDGNLDALEPIRHTIEELIANFTKQRYPIELVSYAIDQVAELTQEPNLGLRLSSELRKRHSRFDSLLRGVEFSLRDYFKILKRYLRLSTEILDLDIHETQGRIRLQLIANSPNTISRHQVESFAAIVVMMVQERPRAQLCSVGFLHAMPSQAQCASVYNNVFGVAPTFSAEQNYLEFSSTDSDTLAAGDLSEFSIQQLRKMENNYSKNFEDSWRSRCQFLLELLLYLGEPRKEALADILALTPRTLQRRLDSEGTSFRALLKELRMSLATQYLAQGNISNQNLAFVLGYQDSSQLFKSFRSWFGVSLPEYRASLRIN